MSKRDEQRNAFRAEVKRAHRAAGKKLSRLKSQGVDSKKIDQRVPADRIESMNGRELRVYYNRLARFNDRKTQYVAGKNGVPLNKARAGLLHELQEQHNARARNYEAGIAGVEISPGNTIGGRIDMLKKPRFSTAKGRRRVFEEFTSTLGNVNGPDALELLIKDARKKTFKNYLSRSMARERETLNQMLEKTGDTEMLEKVNELTDHQLNMMVDYTEFMKAAQDRYVFAKSMNTDSPLFVSQSYENNGVIINDLIDWAGTQPKKAPLSGNVRSEYTDTRARPVPVQKGREYTDTNARPIPTQKPRRKR